MSAQGHQSQTGQGVQFQKGAYKFKGKLQAGVNEGETEFFATLYDPGVGYNDSTSVMLP